MSEFDPYEIMNRELREANTKRLRIVRWLINRAGQDAFISHPISRDYNAMRSPIASEFRGIPFAFDGDFDGQPALKPDYEKRGDKLLIHDYRGPIRHGNDMVRWLDAGMKALEIVKAEREERASAVKCISTRFGAPNAG